MLNTKVDVKLAALGSPSFRRDEKTLNAWELVTFTVGEGGTKIASKVRTIGRCSYVEALELEVNIGVTFEIAKERNEDIENNPDARTKNAYKSLLSLLKQHGAQHHTRVEKQVVPDWRKAFVADAKKTLPTRSKSTSLTQNKLEEQIVVYVDYWVRELARRVRKDAHDWEIQDYPILEHKLQRLPNLSVFLPSGLPKPKRPVQALPRPKLIFPTCRSTTNSLRRTD